jgi:hypothetical protein
MNLLLQSIAKSTSTPARAYAFFVFVIPSEIETSLNISVLTRFPKQKAPETPLSLRIKLQRGKRLRSE